MTPTQIKKLREKFNESQAAFAKRIGVRQATVADWETGTKNPSPMAIKFLEMILKSAPKSASK